VSHFIQTRHPRADLEESAIMSMKRILLFLLSCIFCGQLSAAKPPNVVFFFSDDQAYDTVGCYGNPNVKTPNMDKLGARGVIFDRHYNTTAICMASRANVMTGKLEYKTGCNFSHGPMSKSIWAESYPVLLRKAGYRTAFGGKFGFAVVDDPTRGGSESKFDNLPMGDFDFWVGGTGQTSYATKKNKYLAKYADKYPHSSRAYGAAGSEFVRESAKGDKPFCLTIFFKAPHRPTTPDPMFDDVYADTTFRKLPNYGRAAGEHLAPQHKLGRQYPRFESWGYDNDSSYQAALATYNQQIHGVDYAMGMIMEELERQGVADNTVVIFSSDNGFFNGSHGLGSKVLPYEEGARVPLIIYDPRHAAEGNGRRSSAVTGNIDIGATIVDLAGISKPREMDGRSLLPIVHGRKPRVRMSMPILNAWGPVGAQCLSVVTEQYKFCYWPFGEGMDPSEELFDLKNDPYELKNIVADSKLRQELGMMRRHYDAELRKLQLQAVDYNDYQFYGTLFDRNVKWEDKKGLVPRAFFKAAGK
jgi:arylsulfatase A-like enzyme